MTDAKFISTLTRIENAATVGAWVIIDPGKPSVMWRILAKYPRKGHAEGRLYMLGWLPNAPTEASNVVRHCRSATGYGYDKRSAAMAGAKFWNIKTQTMDVISDNGKEWHHQLEDAGYVVRHVI